MRISDWSSDVCSSDLGIDALFDIGRQEPACVIARDAKRGLGQVVGAEAEERAHFCDLARHQRGARKLDHRTDEIIDPPSLFGKDRYRRPVAHRLPPLKL